MKTKIDCGCEKDVFACRNHAHPQHTPTPWKVYNDTMVFGKSIGGCRQEESDFQIAEMRGWGHLKYSGEERAFEVQKANAAFIVTAVNEREALLAENIRLKHCHEELVATLKMVLANEKLLSATVLRSDRIRIMEEAIARAEGKR